MQRIISHTEIGERPCWLFGADRSNDPNHEKIRQFWSDLSTSWFVISMYAENLMSETFWWSHCKQSNYHCSPDHLSPTHWADHNADRNLNCADWMISAPECPLLICYDDPWCPGEREREWGGGAGQFILFLMLKVSAVRRPQATTLQTRDPGTVVTTIIIPT